MGPAAEPFGNQEVGTAVAECPLRKKAAPKSWIAIRLADEDGRAIGWAEYLLSTGGGTPISGLLDGKGYARVDGLESGVYQVTFPGIDGADWERKVD